MYLSKGVAFGRKYRREAAQPRMEAIAKEILKVEIGSCIITKIKFYIKLQLLDKKANYFVKLPASLPEKWRPKNSHQKNILRKKNPVQIILSLTYEANHKSANNFIERVPQNSHKISWIQHPYSISLKHCFPLSGIKCSTFSNAKKSCEKEILPFCPQPLMTHSVTPIS